MKTIGKGRLEELMRLGAEVVKDPIPAPGPTPEEVLIAGLKSVVEQIERGQQAMMGRMNDAVLAIEAIEIPVPEIPKADPVQVILPEMPEIKLPPILIPEIKVPAAQYPEIKLKTVRITKLRLSNIRRVFGRIDSVDIDIESEII